MEDPIPGFSWEMSAIGLWANTQTSMRLLAPKANTPHLFYSAADDAVSSFFALGELTHF